MNSKVQLVKSAFENHPVFRYLARKFNLESLYYENLSLYDDFDDIFQEQSPRQRDNRLRSKRRQVNVGSSMVQCSSKLSLEEILELGITGERQVHVLVPPETPGKSILTLNSAPQVKDRQPSQHDDKPVKLVSSTTPLDRNSIENEADASMSDQPCQMPGLHGDQNDEKIVQRRTAVCDNIERQLVDDRGISLRQLRKHLVVGNNLKDLSLV